MQLLSSCLFSHKYGKTTGNNRPVLKAHVQNIWEFAITWKLNCVNTHTCAHTHITDRRPQPMRCSLTLTHLFIYSAPCFCKLQQSVKSFFVWSFGVIVSCGAQGFHSSLAINAGLSMLVDFGRQRLSSWACASSYHPGGPGLALLKQTVSVMRALQISDSLKITH